MAKRYAGLKAFGSKAVSVVASGALVLSLTPAIALADPGEAAAAAGEGDLQAQSATLTTQRYEGNQNNKTGKAIIGENGDPLNGGVTLVSSGDNVYKYMGYAHNDGTHYHSYSLYTEITTDDNGIITAIDLASGNDTFAGKWGYYKGKGAAPVEGYLPDGVTFNPVENSDGTWTPVLDGANEYGYQLKSVTLMSVNATGTGDSDSGSSSDSIVANGYSGDKTRIDTRKTASEGAEADNDYYNLVKCTYTIGIGDNLDFNAYFSTGARAEMADQHLDNCVKDDEWTENPIQGKKVVGAGKDDGTSVSYTTNRDGWTGLMATISLRMLSSWGAGLQDPSKVTGGLDGELAAVDTVSGATKTSDPFVNALKAAKDAGYVKGVSEAVKLTIDGKNAADTFDEDGKSKNEVSLPRIDATDNTTTNHTGSQDRATVTGNDDGTYTLNMNLRSYGGGRLSLDAIYLYKLDGKSVGTTGMWQLAQNTAKNSTEPAYESYKSYKPTGEGRASTWADVDDGSIKLTNAKFEQSDPCKAILTTVDPSITHVVFKFTFGHGAAAIAYDLANMARVPEVTELLAAAGAANPDTVAAARAAYDATPYDVRPFTTGIANLHAQEAKLVSDQLNGVSASDGAAVAAARAAYDKLDAAAKAQVESTAIAKLAAAEKVIADARAIEEGSSPANSGLAENERATTGTGAKAAVVEATSATEAAYVAPASQSTKKVTVPATVKVNGQTYKVTSIEANAFKGSKATSVTVGKNVKTIAAKAFNGATKLKSVSLGKGVTKLSKGAFKGAAKLAKVTISSSKLTKSSALKGAFKGSKVKTVVLKNMTAKQKKAVKRAILKYGGKRVTVK